MAATELQKKAISFVIFLAIAGLILFSLPVFEEWLRVSVLRQFGLAFRPHAWELLPESIDSTSMAPSYVNAIDAFFRILKIFLWMTVVIQVVRFVAQIILRTAYRNKPQTDASGLLKTVLSIIIYIIAFALIFQTQYPNISLAPLFTGSTILGIVVGLAVQDTLGNLFAGLALQADQPFQVGDVILITNRGTGVVESVSWRGVKIRTFQNKLLIISNAVLGKETIEVAPKGNLNARAVFFNTQYSFSPARTIQLVREAVRLTENVSPKLRPVVRIRGFGESSLDWEVKYWLEDYALHDNTDALIRQGIYYLFNREKIEFAYPVRVLHIEKKAEERAPEEVFNSISEILNRVEIFAPLSDEEIERLANASTTRVYAPGEAIVRIGQEGNSMCVIIRGEVKVQIPENSYQKTVNTLRVNDFFGEMSLLTGEPRSATVIAVEETEVLRIDKNGLKPIFEGNPELVDAISELIEERKLVLKTQSDSTSDEQTKSKRGPMKSIRKFFGLK